ncbi:hypothetical protein [Rhizobium sp. BR 314]|uniref:hypothetical protein n=1 Tax=Rhizobium sp. BR 314 TaxID=3040013 RepID=UPI0039BF4311
MSSRIVNTFQVYRAPPVEADVANLSPIFAFKSNIEWRPPLCRRGNFQFESKIQIVLSPVEA